jgi:hypothetical protein
VHREARQLHGRLAIIRERRAHCQTVAADRGGRCVLAFGHLALDLSNAARVFLEFSLGMPIGFDDRLGSFFEIVELAELVRNVGQGALDCQADRPLGIRGHCQDRNRECLLDLTQEVSQVLLTRTGEAAGEQHFTRECITQHPQHILGFEGLQTVDGQDDVALLREAVREPGLVSEAQREQLFVALQQIGDGAWSDGDMQVVECLVDLGDAPMLTVAQGADMGNHIQAELGMWESPGTLFLGANRLMVV